MSEQSLAEFVKSISYKPGWEFHLRQDSTITALHVSVLTRCADHPEHAITIFMVCPIYEDHPDTWEASVECLIRNVEDHEREEWLRIGGKRVSEPHPHSALVEKYSCNCYAVPAGWSPSP